MAEWHTVDGTRVALGVTTGNWPRSASGNQLALQDCLRNGRPRLVTVPGQTPFGLVCPVGNGRTPIEMKTLDEHINDNPTHTGFWTFSPVHPLSWKQIEDLRFTPGDQDFLGFRLSGSGQLEGQTSPSAPLLGEVKRLNASDWLNQCLLHSANDRHLLASQIVTTYGQVVRDTPFDRVLQQLKLSQKPISLGPCGTLRYLSVEQGKLSTLTEMDTSSLINMTLTPPSGSPPGRLTYPPLSGGFVFRSAEGDGLLAKDNMTVPRQRDEEIMRWLTRVVVTLEQDNRSISLLFRLE